MAEAAHPDYLAAVAEGRTEESGVFVDEAIGLMRDVSPAADIPTRMTKEAEALLRGRAAELITECGQPDSPELWQATWCGSLKFRSTRENVPVFVCSRRSPRSRDHLRLDHIGQVYGHSVRIIL
jgi:hypothetical protein